ncbi:MAG: 50S ribosomal protein L19 [bacterium]
MKEKYDIKIGDIVKVYYKIKEGDKERVQPFEGVIIAKKGAGVSRTFTVRKIGNLKIGVERIFPFHSPNIEKVEVIKSQKVRRSKLYYLRDKNVLQV